MSKVMSREMYNACINDDSIYIETALKNGYDINSQYEDGVTCLILAVDNGHYILAKELIKRGADRSIKDNHGMTAFDYARQEYELYVNLFTGDSIEEKLSFNPDPDGEDLTIYEDMPWR